MKLPFCLEGLVLSLSKLVSGSCPVFQGLVILLKQLVLLLRRWRRGSQLLILCRTGTGEAASFLLSLTTNACRSTELQGWDEEALTYLPTSPLASLAATKEELSTPVARRMSAAGKEAERMQVSNCT